MAPLRELLTWTDRLTGLDPDRVLRAISTIEQWAITSLSQRLARPRTIDDAVRAVLLAEGVAHLVARGAPTNKLLSKLRDDAQFEAVWAEIRCASVLAESHDEDVEVVLEHGKRQGAHADIRLLFPEGPPYTSVEVKAVGLSDDEVDFCARMRQSLDVVIPPFGMVTVPAPLDGKPPVWTPQLAAHHRHEAARRAAGVPNYPAGMAAAVIVARGAEDAYIRRAVSRVQAAVRQLPLGDECWVALYWTNGAPARQVATAVDWASIPGHVAGLLFIGSVVAFPHRDINVFIIAAPRDLRPDSQRVVESSLDVHFADTVLNRAESSSGVRATLIRGNVRGKRRQLLRRDGRERLPPFNLVLDRDPANVARTRVA